MTTYREVKRKASVGERIKIVAPFMAVGYGLDDEFTVRLVDGDDSGDVRVPRYDGGGDLRYIAYREYVVLEPVTPAEPDALAANFRQFVLDNADAIRAILPQVEALATKAPAQLTPVEPLTRAEVIAKATADVSELLRTGRSLSARLPDGQFREKFYTAEIHVNRDKRTVVALVSTTTVRGEVLRRNAAKGIAKAAPDDVFHAEIGKAIALRRALGLTVPGEYTDAPKPTPASGAKVVFTGSSGRTRRMTLARRCSARDGYTFGNFAFTTVEGGWIANKQYVVIDDTDVDYTKEVA